MKQQGGHQKQQQLLKRAKKACDYLIVGISTDELIERIKGKKPVISFDQRWEIIEALGIADHIVAQNYIDKVYWKKKLNFDIVFVGNDHIKDWERRYDNKLKIVYLPYTKGVSTSKIRKKI